MLVLEENAGQAQRSQVAARRPGQSGEAGL